ncbi:MAG TPA: hypothetical protein VFM18_04755 [Methanosarcina sp.]|nr:hypothetical protein [Methanosarcina sp.]
MTATSNTTVSGTSNLQFDSSGNLIASIVPRTDTLANLSALAGGVGELSSATDVPAIVKHNGVAGGAVPITAFDSVYAYTFSTGTGTVSGTINPLARTVTVTIGGAVTQVNVTLGNGSFNGQLLTLHHLSGGNIAVYTINGSTIQMILGDSRMTIVWNGSSWQYYSSEILTTKPIYAQTIGYAKYGAFYQGQITTGTGIGKNANSFTKHEIYLSGQTPNNTGSVELTVAGQAAVLGTTRLDLTTFLSATGVHGSCRLRVVGKRTGSSSSNFVQFLREFNVYVNAAGVASLVGTVDTIGTDANHTSGLGASMPTLTIAAGNGGTDGSLVFTVTGSTVAALDWFCHVEIFSCYYN